MNDYKLQEFAPAPSMPARPLSPALHQPTSPDGLLPLLEGCVIMANDGKMLGVITHNQFAHNSILNEFGPHGSKFSASSIFNQFGSYGSEFSALSPFNQYTSTPPQIVSPSGQLMGYLTINQFKTPAINPHSLIELLKRTQ